MGAGAAVAAQCEPVSGHASESGDCDDADAAISPGAEETCDNGVDEDCDGGGRRIEGDWDAEEHAAFTILIPRGSGRIIEPSHILAEARLIAAPAGG